jgi:hypothetical protein
MNPIIKIHSLGNRWFKYTIIYTREDGSIIREIKGDARVNEEIIIPKECPPDESINMDDR